VRKTDAALSLREDLRAIGLFPARDLLAAGSARPVPSPKLLGGGMSHKALTWAFASSAAKSSGYMADQRKRDHGIWSWSRISVQKNLALIRVLAGQGRNIYGELQ